MTSFNSGEDETLYTRFGELINPAYPSYLKRLGLNNLAVRAEGATITDSSGKTYIDCIGGYGLFNIGHNHPKVIDALHGQLDQKNLFTKPLISKIQVSLAEKLNEITPEELTCSYICCGGSEAIDNAIKLARLSKRKPGIIAASNSFHGYTFGALSVSGVEAFKKPFEPMLPGVSHIPFGDAAAFDASLDSDTAAVLLEIVQHEAGVQMPGSDYFGHVSRICSEKGIVLIIDEIKTGLGKTGKMFAIEHHDFTPDILVIGKSLGGGLFPVSAMIAKKKLWRRFGLSFSMSASSFAGNVLGSCAALTTIEVVQKSNLIENCIKMGKTFMEGLMDMKDKYPSVIKNVSGIGLLIGVESSKPGYSKEIVNEMIVDNVLVSQAFGNGSVLMIEPPLCINEIQVQAVLTAFDRACRKQSERNQ